MKIFKQIIKEFWFPFICASAWSIHSVLQESSFETFKAISSFAAAFFFISWGTAQFFRIHKQNKFDDEFKEIHTKFSSLFQQLEEKTENLIGNLTGGDSFCYWHLTDPGLGSNVGVEAVSHCGKYPLFNVKARIVDIDKMSLSKSEINLKNMQNYTISRAYESLTPKHVKFSFDENFDLGEVNERRFNILWTALNGSFEQLLRYKKINGRWCFATKVKRGETFLYTKIPENFPKNEKGEIDW